MDCPETWLDRPLDSKAVDRLVEKIKDKSAIQNETQSWLAIANINNGDLKDGQTMNDLLEVCTIKVIEGTTPAGGICEGQHIPLFFLYFMSWNVEGGVLTASYYLLPHLSCLIGIPV